MEKLYYTNNEEKYDVSFDREEMLKLREEIINKLSNVVHFDYESNKKGSPYYRLAPIDPLEIRNFSQKVVGTKENAFGKEAIIHYVYDRYEFPYLITLMDRIMSDDYAAIDEIKNPDLLKERTKSIHQLKMLERSLVEAKTIEAKLEIVYELNYLLSRLMREKDNNPFTEYYQKVLDLIHLDRVVTKELK